MNSKSTQTASKWKDMAIDAYENRRSRDRDTVRSIIKTAKGYRDIAASDYHHEYSEPQTADA